MHWLDMLTLVLVSLGALFFVSGLVGLLRFPNALSRMHALSKADNVGLGLVVLGLLPQASWPFGALKLVALWLVVVLVGGATGQMLAAAIHAGRQRAPATVSPPDGQGRRAPGGR